jgi:RNA polymerase sigma factor (TIGR02999 family)
MSSPQKPVASTDLQPSSVVDPEVVLDQVFTRLYNRIRLLASRLRWYGANPTLNPTALVHEAYIKLRKNPPDLETKSHEEIIGIFANAMHQILIDASRRKAAQKRFPVDAPGSPEFSMEDAIAIAEAVQKLEAESPRQARIIQCRFLLGMTAEETAAALHTGVRTVEREWQEAKGRLNQNLR